jgi:hypothetical protein
VCALKRELTASAFLHSGLPATPHLCSARLPRLPSSPFLGVLDDARYVNFKRLAWTPSTKGIAARILSLFVSRFAALAAAWYVSPKPASLPADSPDLYRRIWYIAFLPCFGIRAGILAMVRAAGG